MADILDINLITKLQQILRNNYGSVKIIFEKYKKIFSLILSLIVTIIVTFLIKYYFKPFIVILIMSIICTPLYKFLLRLNMHEKIAGAVTIIAVNIVLILTIIYMGGEIYSIAKKVYLSNVQMINRLIQDISKAVNIDFNNLKIGRSVFSIINDAGIRQGAVSTGDSILAYFIANVCTFFVLVDRESITEVLYELFPGNIIKKFMKQKNNFVNMISIQGMLILLSTIEIILGFMVLGIPKSFMLGLICGILDLLPYVGTIIVFIPIIIYNIIMKNYLVSFGLICLYILVQIVREILEAKFLGNKLDIHPLVIFISIYIGAKVFGILGILVGPMYSIIAKEIIYSEIE